MLDSGFYENLVWGALHKALERICHSQNKDEYDKMVHYTGIIQELQDDFRLRISSFPHIGKSALAFHSACLAN